MKIAARFLSIVTVILATSYLLPATALAAPGGPPNPQPCKNPLEDDFNLVDNYITNQDGDAPIIFVKPVPGNVGDTVFLSPQTFTFPVDFSKLQSLFANSNSKYLEGDFQSAPHRSANLLELPRPLFNAFHGPTQKIITKLFIDDLKKNYVNYVYNKPELAESSNQYNDIEGQGDLKTIYDLVNQFGLPEPPTTSSTDSEEEAWDSTWGMYWEKIPTAWSEFYEGEIAFHWFAGSDQALEEFQELPVCPPRIEPPIRFVMPEFFRTTAVSDQLNLTLVPRAAQSYQDHGILDNLLAQENSTHANIITRTISKCWEIITSTPTEIAKTLRKVVQISQDFLNPINIVFAAKDDQNETCLKPVLGGKEGTAPYCPLPLSEKARLGSAASCFNRDDPNKLETDNPNVVCTFTITWPGFNQYQIQEDDPFCPPPNETLRCIKVRIWPNIRIPWLAAIWNDTFYSEDDPSLQGLNQVTGRPGFFGIFTPKAITEGKDLDPQELLNYCEQVGGNDPLCQMLGDIFDQCIAAGGDFGDCLISTLKALPGTAEEEPSTEDVKERFIGAVDECGKEFSRDNALMPRAVQEIFGIEMNCAISTP